MIKQKITFSTEQDLLEILSNFDKRQQFLTLDSTVVKKANKKSRLTGELFTDVFKGEILATKKEYVSIYHNYQDSINNRLAKQGSDQIFVSEGLPYGTWYQPDLIIEHNEKFQLRYFQDKNSNYRHSEYVFHYANGDVLDSALVERYWAEFAPPVSKSKKQDEVGVELETKPRNVKFEGLNRLVVGDMILIRKGREQVEDTDSILDWHELGK